MTVVIGYSTDASRRSKLLHIWLHIFVHAVLHLNNVASAGCSHLQAGKAWLPTSEVSGVNDQSLQLLKAC